MNYYEIGSIKVGIEFGSDELIERRLSAYKRESCTPDLEITVEVKEKIELEGKLKEVSVALFRHYALDENGNFVVYDVLRDGSVTAVLKMDKAVKKASLQAIDLEPLGGANISVRRFNMLGEVFKYAAIARGGIVFHSSAMCYDGQAVLFSAKSGTGKSTHTGLWKQYYPESYVFNDDSPVIMIENGKPFAYGTPWSGKTEINLPVRLPIRAIVFLERDVVPSIERLNDSEHFMKFVGQSFVVPYSGFFVKYLAAADSVYKHVEMFRLKCDISKSSVDVVKEKLFVKE